MSIESDNQAPVLPGRSALDAGNLNQLFFDGLPAMTAVVTLVAQPFAQLRDSFSLPIWLPALVAIVVSGLLAFYKLHIVRRSPMSECAICAPILMFVIFAAYTAGNNAVYYAKEGYSKPKSGQQSGEDLKLRDREIDLLQKQLQSASHLIETLRATLNVPAPAEGPPSSSSPSPLGFLRGLYLGDAHAQEPRPPATSGPRPSAEKSKQLSEEFKKYDAQKKEVKDELKQIRQEQERQRPTAPPLIKTW
jgi:hypothetical protein